jgi:hypothetical protein
VVSRSVLAVVGKREMPTYSLEIDCTLSRSHYQIRCDESVKSSVCLYVKVFEFVKSCVSIRKAI